MLLYSVIGEDKTMAYLDEYSTNQSLKVLVCDETEVPVVIESEMTIVLDANEAVENSNFQIAEQLRIQRSKLINAISQFPVTALWLLNEADQNPVKSKKSESTTIDAEQTSNLENIKRYFLLTNSFVNTKVMGSNANSESLQRLRAEASKYPYSFEDLSKIVDIIVFAYKYRGLSCQPAGMNDKNGSILIKRLEGIGRRASLNASKFNELIKKCDDHQFDEQFLFLTTNEMQRLFNEIVLAENLWLKARQQLTSANHRLVLFISNQYRGSFLAFDDLVQEGQIGLIKAVDRYDHRLGFQFSTYAGYWIRQAISRSLSRSERVVRIPCGQVANINKVYRAKEELFLKNGAEVTVNELSKFTQFSENEINTILSISQAPMPLENFDDDDENQFSPIDFLEQQVFTHPFFKIAESELENLIDTALKTLSPREAQIICCHFGIGNEKEMTLQDIGSEMNLTRERVRQIQVKALNKLKMCYGQDLGSFL
jgi:RNA polymerase primary sigma factor